MCIVLQYREYYNTTIFDTKGIECKWIFGMDRLLITLMNKFSFFWKSVSEDWYQSPTESQRLWTRGPQDKLETSVCNTPYSQ